VAWKDALQGRRGIASVVLASTVALLARHFSHCGREVTQYGDDRCPNKTILTRPHT
jgi:hypothetical protein